MIHALSLYPLQERKEPALEHVSQSSLSRVEQYIHFKTEPYFPSGTFPNCNHKGCESPWDTTQEHWDHVPKPGVAHAGIKFDTTAFVMCYADVIATVFGMALAEATMSAQCFVDDADAVATAVIAAEVGTYTYEYEHCDLNRLEEGYTKKGKDDSLAAAFWVVRSACCSWPTMCGLMR